MKKKVTFGTDPEKRSKLEDYAKQKNMNLTDVLNYIIDCHFEKVESFGDRENALKRIEDKLDLLLLQVMDHQMYVRVLVKVIDLKRSIY